MMYGMILQVFHENLHEVWESQRLQTPLWHSRYVRCIEMDQDGELIISTDGKVIIVHDYADLVEHYLSKSAESRFV
jgi:hypothetical protein